jgi:hypothetical protein
VGERRRRRFGGVKAGAAALLSVGVLGAVFAPSALAGISGSGGRPHPVGGAAPAAAAPTPGAPGSGTMAVSPKVMAVSPASWNAAAAARFWTPARLASAVPADASPTASKHAAAATGIAPRLTAPSWSTMARSTHFSGAPATGVIFYAGQDLTTHYCTASVVNSRYGNLIIMAAHCNPGSWMAYVPQYQRGAATQPYGIWAVTKAFKDSHYSGVGAGTDYDYAFAQVAKNSQSQTVQSVTGGYWLSRTPSYYEYVTTLGYPKVRADSADQAIRCQPNYRTQKLPGYRQMVLYCTGFYGGTSGGPWITYFNGRTGYLVGITGGYQEGGPNSWTSYSPVFDDRIFSLFSWAQSH